jgi:hypothetical protein
MIPNWPALFLFSTSAPANICSVYVQHYCVLVVGCVDPSPSCVLSGNAMNKSNRLGRGECSGCEVFQRWSTQRIAYTIIKIHRISHLVSSSSRSRAAFTAATLPLIILSALGPLLPGFRITIQVLQLTRLCCAGSLAASLRCRTCVRGRSISLCAGRSGGSLRGLGSLPVYSGALSFCLRVGLGSRAIDRIPRAVFVLLPTVIDFLVSVAVLPGVNVTTTALPYKPFSVLSTSGDDSAAL